MTSVGVPVGALLPLLGRRTELAELRRRLPSERLVTVTGEPGCGTTTLAFAAAADFARAQHEPVHTVVVADLDAADVPHAVAVAAELPPDVRPTAQGVAGALQERSALLVLDGCERHVDACAALVDAVLAEAPSVRV